MSNKVKVKDVDTPTMRDEKVFHNIALVVMILHYPLYPDALRFTLQ